MKQVDMKQLEGDHDAVLRGLAEAEAAARAGLPPVESWRPARRYRLDMRIARDGTWYHEGAPIRRERLVNLFSRILKREADGSFHLVTPAEQAEISVEDAPFIAVAMTRAGEGREQTLAFTTAQGDVAVAGRDHALRFEIDPETGETSPYVHVRGSTGGGLEARLSRPVYYELAELVEEHEVDGTPWLGVWSGGVFFPVMPADAAEVTGP